MFFVDLLATKCSLFKNLQIGIKRRAKAFKIPKQNSYYFYYFSNSVQFYNRMFDSNKMCKLSLSTFSLAFHFKQRIDSSSNHNVNRKKRGNY